MRNSMRYLGLSFAMATLALSSGCSDNKADGGTGGLAAKVEPAGKPANEAGKCAKHGDPEELCFVCDASLREKGRLWCTEHDRYEDRCFICHPELKDDKRLWCQEHSLYEDECHLCHPQILKKAGEAAPAGKPSASLNGKVQDSKRLMCKEHSVYEDECGICHPELASGLSFGGGLKIRFLTEEAAGKVGVRTTKSRSGQTSSTVTCLAEVGYNQNRRAEITPIVEGIIRAVPVDLGTQLKQGDLLAAIASIDISQAESAYLSAVAQTRLAEETFKREQGLRSKAISPEQDLQRARAAVDVAEAKRDSARQHLRTLGVDDEQIARLESTRRATGILELRAPFEGEVIERRSVPGAMAKAGEMLFRVADLSSMWATLTLPEAQLASVRVGQTVHLKLDAYPDEEFVGKLTWISSEVDETTRMAKARAEFDNPDGRLRANMFATAKVELSAPQNAVLIPDQSVQWLANRPFAFVRESRDLYSARPLLLGARTDGFRAVMAGLQAGENVVSEGSFSLKSQFLISRLGAGCVDD